jgi:hypothetical protein
MWLLPDNKDIDTHLGVDAKRTSATERQIDRKFLNFVKIRMCRIANLSTFVRWLIMSERTTAKLFGWSLGGVYIAVLLLNALLR